MICFDDDDGWWMMDDEWWWWWWRCHFLSNFGVNEFSTRFGKAGIQGGPGGGAGGGNVATCCQGQWGLAVYLVDAYYMIRLFTIWSCSLLSHFGGPLCPCGYGNFVQTFLTFFILANEIVWDKLMPTLPVLLKYWRWRTTRDWISRLKKLQISIFRNLVGDTARRVVDSTCGIWNSWPVYTHLNTVKRLWDRYISEQD